ncbi:MAG: hypothetical protein SFU86_03565 [Pirellulaceae bacterium]|nr:hypothetical protein [Pirellulaceae bacterium]
MEKSFDAKLRRIVADSSCRDFILADAKDGDMGLGLAAPGKSFSAATGDQAFRTLASYRQAMRDITRQGLVDIMLMSVSTGEQLALVEGLFGATQVTPAVRANDTSDIWCGDSASYKHEPSLAFATTTPQQARCGGKVDLALYSITFNNDARIDREALERYRQFRHEAEQAGLRHFLEVFSPNAPVRPIEDVPRYVNDCIVRCVAGVAAAGRPLFLKMPYYGPRAMSALVHYDPSLVVGILGGSSGTTHDAFRMLWEAKKYGARAALFGRKINGAEHQLTFVKTLRAVADDQLDPAEAVRRYHGELALLKIPPHRSLEDDLKLTQV